MFLNLLKMEYQKLFFRRLFWIQLAVILPITIVGLLFAYYSKDILAADQIRKTIPGFQSAKDGATYNFALALGITPFAAFSTYIVSSLTIIVVGLTCAQEFSWRTMQLWVSRGISRSHLLWAKALIYLLGTCVILLVLFIVSVISSTILIVCLYGSFPSSYLLVLAEVLLLYAEVLYALLPYMALAFSIAILTHSAAAAISVSLLFILIVQGLLIQILGYLGTIGDSIASYLPQSLTSVLLGQDTGLSSHPTMPGALLGLAAYTIFFLSIAFWYFQRQDLTN